MGFLSNCCSNGALLIKAWSLLRLQWISWKEILYVLSKYYKKEVKFLFLHENNIVQLSRFYYQLILFPFSTSFLNWRGFLILISEYSKSSEMQLFDMFKKVMLGKELRIVKTSDHSEIKLSVKSNSAMWRSLLVFIPFNPEKKSYFIIFSLGYLTIEFELFEIHD